MSPSQIRTSVISERISWVRQMLSSLHNLPLASYEDFVADPRNPAAAESYLRRGLEALFDLGRHILAKGFALAAPEYKDIAFKLQEVNILSQEHCTSMRRMAGYRNRMVHFYHEISREELYRLCTKNLKDIEIILDQLVNWLREHPDKLDHGI